MKKGYDHKNREVKPAKNRQPFLIDRGPFRCRMEKPDKGIVRIRIDP
jgi:stalled ribosome alternative rescue factor ArfA